MELLFLADLDPSLARENAKQYQQSANSSTECNPNLLYFDYESDNCAGENRSFMTTESNNLTFINPYARNESLARVEIVVQIVIFICAVLGNSLVLFALQYRKKKTSRMKYFIMHLTIADLLVAFLNILPQLAWEITFRFQGNDFMCRTVKYLQLVVLYLSTYILVITSVDRYRAICHPLTFYKWTRKHCHLAVGLVWCLSLLLASPQLYIFSLQEVGNGTGIYDCWATFNPPWMVTPYVTMFFSTIYIIPFCIMTFLYGRICYEVCRNFFLEKQAFGNCGGFSNGIVYKFNGTGHISVIGEKRQTNDSSHGRNNIRRHASLKVISRSKMKTVKLTFVVVIAYLICWSPFMITQMWWAFDPAAPVNHGVFVICLLLASLNSCVNPWIYMAFSGNLMRQIMPCFSPKKPKLRQRVDDVHHRQGQDKLLRNGVKHAGGGTKTSGTPRGIRLMSLKNTLFSKSQPTKMTGTSDSLKSRLAIGRVNQERCVNGVTSPRGDANEPYWMHNGVNRNAQDGYKYTAKAQNVKSTSV